MESVLAAMRAHGLDRQANYAFALNQYAVPVLLSSGDLAGAEAKAREAIAVFRATQGKDPPFLLANLAEILVARGKLDEADRVVASALELMGRDEYAAGLFRAVALNQAARVAAARGDLAKAGDLFGRALAVERHQAPDGTRETALTLAGLASTLRGEDRARRCRDLLGEAARIDARLLAPTHPERLAIEKDLAACPPPPAGT